MSDLRVVPVERPRKWGETLRIVDALSGRPVQVEPGCRRPLRVRAHLAGRGGADSADLRVLLVADVLKRVAELYGGQALVGVTDTAVPLDHRPALLSRAADLGIHPPVVHGRREEIRQALAGAIDVHVAAATGELNDCEAQVSVAVGPIHPVDAPVSADPAAVRLALLGRRHHEPVGLTPQALRAAGATLTRWRHAVARWSEAPSKPMCAEVLGQALAGLRDDLGTPAALAALARLEASAEVPAGSRFETFSHLDRVLGLELTRRIGRTSPEEGEGEAGR